MLNKSAVGVRFQWVAVQFNIIIGKTMEIKIWREGETIIEEGSHGTCAYVIEAGKVEVSIMQRDTKVVLTILEENQVFGEMGLIEDKPRSATVVALEETTLRIISRDSFNCLFEKNRKVILSIVKALFERLRTASDIIASSNAKTESAYNEISTTGKIMIKDMRYIEFAGTNDKAKVALKFETIKIKMFPFKVGRFVHEDNSSPEDILTDNNLKIRDVGNSINVSRNHFLIDKMEGHFVVVDRGSQSGVNVNGKKISGSVVLDKNTNVVSIGYNSPFVFKLEIKGELKTEVATA